MERLPQIICEAWEQRDGPAVLATVSPEGLPNIIYVTCVSIYNDTVFVIADNYFDKTRRNLQAGSRGALLFLDKDGKAYQVKGTFHYHEHGAIFEFMKEFNPPEHPGHAAVALHLDEAYSGAKKLHS